MKQTTFDIRFFDYNIAEGVFVDYEGNEANFKLVPHTNKSLNRWQIEGVDGLKDFFYIDRTYKSFKIDLSGKYLSSE